MQSLLGLGYSGPNSDRHPRPHPATLHSPGHLQFWKEEAEESYLDQFHWINEDGLLTIAVFRRYQNVAFLNSAVLQKPGVDALQGKQGLVTAAFDDFALGHDQDLVGIADCA